MSFGLPHQDYYSTPERVEAYIEKDRPWITSTTQVLKNMLCDLPSSGSVLDVGCGYGRDVKTFQELGYQAIGVDASGAMIEVARKNYGDYFQTLAIENLESLNQRFDIVQCRNVLVHIYPKDLLHIITCLYNVTVKGGVILLISKEGSGVSVTHTTGFARETILHSKEAIANIFSNLGGILLEPPYTLEKASANGDALFCIRIKK